MLSSFNIVDVFLLIVLLMCIVYGYSKGFFIGMMDFIKWIGGFIIALAGYQYIAAFIRENTQAFGAWLLPVSFLIALILATIILSAIANLVYRSLHYDVHQHGVNKLFGIIPGILKGIVYLVIFVALLISLPLFDKLSEKTRESIIASRLSDKVAYLDAQISPVFDEAVRRSMTRLTVEPDSKESVKLHYTVSDPKPRPDLEERMLELVNQERAKEGLHALKPDPEMTEVARAHSRDMFARGYFSHNSPEGKDPFDRIRAAKINFITAGENLALGQTLKICHEGLMNSPGHKANILRPAFGRLGIGVLDGGMYGLMISQEFRN